MALRYSRPRASRSILGKGIGCERLEDRTLFAAPLIINGTPGNDVIRLGVIHWGSPFFADGVSYTLNGVKSDLAPLPWTSITINTMGGNDTINIEATLAPTDITGGGTDVVNVGDAVVGVQNIKQPLNATNPTGITDLRVDDSPHTSSHGGTIGTSSIQSFAPATISYSASALHSLVVLGGPAGNLFNVLGTPAGIVTTLDTGNGSDSLYVSATSADSQLNVNGNNGSDYVFIGTDTGVQSILGDIHIASALPQTSLIIDDSEDPVARHSNMTSTGIFNLAPAVIGYSNLSDLTVNGGSGGNTFSVGGTIAGIPTYLSTGAGNDTTTVVSTAAGGTLAVVGNAGADHVIVGNQGTVQPIAGAVNISMPSGSTAVSVDDSADPTARAATLATGVLPPFSTEWNILTGLAPAPIAVQTLQTSSLGLTLGTAGNTLDVGATRVPTSVDGGGGIFLRPFPLPPILLGGNDIINVGNAGTVQGIAAPLTISNLWGKNTINLNDPSDTGRTVLLDNVSLGTVQPYGGVTGLAPAPIDYEYAGTGALNVFTGPGADTFNVRATGAPTNLTGGGADHVNVTSAGSVQGIAGNLTIETPGGQTTLAIDDSADPTARGITLAAAPPAGDTDPFDVLSGLSPGVITFEAADVASPVIITCGSGGNTIAITGLSPAHSGGNSGPSIQLATGAGDDTVNVSGGSVGTSLGIDAQGGNDTLNADYSAGLGTLAADVTFAGGAGSNRVAVTGTRGAAFDVTDVQITRGTQHIRYSGVGALALGLGAFNVSNNLNGMSLTANGRFTNVNMAVSQSLTDLSVLGGAAAALTHGPTRLSKLLTLRSLVIETGSTLDLANNELQLPYRVGVSFAPLIRNDLAAGLLVSSDAAANAGYGLGYADSADAAVSGLRLPAHVIDVRYTRKGDANLDGSANFNDLLLLAQNYGNTSGSAVWDIGDSNYDGSANFVDLLLLAQNYGQVAASAPQSASVAATASILDLLHSRSAPRHAARP